MQIYILLVTFFIANCAKLLERYAAESRNFIAGANLSAICARSAGRGGAQTRQRLTEVETRSLLSATG